MSDFSMCQNTRCPIATQCRRSELSGTVPNSLRQTYTIFTYDFENKKCEYHKPVEKICLKSVTI